MSLNPLGLPKWGRKQPLRIAKKWKTVDPGPAPPPPPVKPRLVYRSRKEEIEEQAKQAAQHITIEIRGLEAAKSGTYKLAFDPSHTLGHYLGQLNLKNIVTKAAIYDTTNLEVGRVKLRYVPAPGAAIFIGPPTYSPVAHLQRTVHDGMRLANRSAVDSVSMKYGPKKEPKKPKKAKNPDEVDQW